MRYGICTGIENAGLVKKLGYDYIELSVTKTMGLDPAAYAAGKKALEESGIEAECFNILFPKTMNFVDGKTTNLDALEAYLEKARSLPSCTDSSEENPVLVPLGLIGELQ